MIQFSQVARGESIDTAALHNAKVSRRCLNRKALRSSTTSG